MTPREINILDSLAGICTDDTLAALNTLGQDKERGYRKALHRLVRRNIPSSWLDYEWLLERFVRALNFVVHFIGIHAEIWFAQKGMRLSDDQRIDLVGFFVARMENMEAKS